MRKAMGYIVAFIIGIMFLAGIIDNLLGIS